MSYIRWISKEVEDDDPRDGFYHCVNCGELGFDEPYCPKCGEGAKEVIDKLRDELFDLKCNSAGSVDQSIMENPVADKLEAENSKLRGALEHVDLYLKTKNEESTTGPIARGLWKTVKKALGEIVGNDKKPGLDPSIENSLNEYFGNK